MQYLQLEQTLNRLSGHSIINGPFYGYAGALQNILVDKSLTGEQRAKSLTNFINDVLEVWNKKPKKDLQLLTVDDYMKNTGKSRSTVCRWLKRGLIPGARRIGEGKNSKWVILNKT